MLDLAAAIAHLSAFRASLKSDAVIDEAAELTAIDLDAVLERLDEIENARVPWRPGMPAID